MRPDREGGRGGDARPGPAHSARLLGRLAFGRAGSKAVLWPFHPAPRQDSSRDNLRPPPHPFPVRTDMSERPSPDCFFWPWAQGSWRDAGLHPTENPKIALLGETHTPEVMTNPSGGSFRCCSVPPQSQWVVWVSDFVSRVNEWVVFLLSSCLARQVFLRPLGSAGERAGASRREEALLQLVQTGGSDHAYRVCSSGLSLSSHRPLAGGPGRPCGAVNLSPRCQELRIRAQGLAV